MKRYTKEFLHDAIRTMKERHDTTLDAEFLARIEKLQRTERAIDRGYITDFEAIRDACRIIDGET